MGFILDTIEEERAGDKRLQLVDIPLGNSFADELGHVADTKLAHDVLAVELDGVGRHKELPGNLIGGFALGDEPEHVNLARGEQPLLIDIFACLAEVIAVIAVAREHTLQGDLHLLRVVGLHHDGIGTDENHLAQCPQLLVKGVEDEGTVGRTGPQRLHQIDARHVGQLDIDDADRRVIGDCEFEGLACGLHTIDGRKERQALGQALQTQGHNLMILDDE